MTSRGSTTEDSSRQLHALSIDSQPTEANSLEDRHLAGSVTPPPLLSPTLSLSGGSAERIFPIRSVKHYRQSTPSSPSLLRKHSGQDPAEAHGSDGTVPDLHVRTPAAESQGSRLSKDDAELLMTSRFEHTVLENGDNWIITGNQGKLERCEDEVSSLHLPIELHLYSYRALPQPIRSPGAVQSFGVLLVFDQTPTGDLFVQQVSEVSHHSVQHRPVDSRAS